MKISLTGANGFIGKNLLTKLLKDNHKVSILSNKPCSNKLVKVFSGNLSSGDSVIYDFLKDSDVVINCAGEVSNNKKRPALSGVNYLMMLGYVFGGWMMIKTASKSIDLKNDKSMDEDFLNAKITTSSIYLSSILPKIESLSSIILNGDEDILSMKYNWL